MSAARATVLVVDDDDLFRQTMVRLLKAAGHAVVEARGTIEALAAARRTAEPIDLLVTDVAMDGGDGLSLARDLADRCRDLKVLFISGYGASVVRRAVRNTWGRDFLDKPFTPAAFETAVERLLAATGRAPPQG